MKMFMLTLEGKSRDWYECLRSSSFLSLKDLEYVFYENYKEFNILLKKFKNIDESVEEEMIRAVKNIPQDIPEN